MILDIGVLRCTIFPENVEIRPQNFIKIKASAGIVNFRAIFRRMLNQSVNSALAPTNANFKIKGLRQVCSGSKQEGGESPTLNPQDYM